MVNHCIIAARQNLFGAKTDATNLDSFHEVRTSGGTAAAAVLSGPIGVGAGAGRRRGWSQYSRDCCLRKTIIRSYSQRLGQSSFECERSNLRNFGQISEARCCAGQARALIRKTWSASAKSLSIRSNQTSQRSTKPRRARPVALAARFRGTGRSSHWKTTLHWIGSRPHSSITRVAECGATAIGVRHSWAMWA